MLSVCALPFTFFLTDLEGLGTLLRVNLVTGLFQILESKTIVLNYVKVLYTKQVLCVTVRVTVEHDQSKFYVCTLANTKQLLGTSAALIC